MIFHRVSFGSRDENIFHNQYSKKPQKDLKDNTAISCNLLYLELIYQQLLNCIFESIDISFG